MKKYVLLLMALACSDPPGRSEGASTQANGASPGGDSARKVTNDTGRVLAADTGRRQTGKRTILFAGTSLTVGLGLDPDSAYPQHVQRMIDSAGLPYEVVNAGVSGETSSALLRRLDWLLREPYDILVIETGANDGLRGIPVDAMARNIQQIIDRARAARPDARIALVQMEAPPNMGRTYTQRFRQTYPEIARRSGVVLLPFLLQDVAGVRELNQGDGIHPNNAGSRIVARNVWKGLKPLLR